MKKYNYVLLILVVTFLYTGCASPPPEIQVPVKKNDIPDFVRNTPLQKEEIFGIGSAKLPTVHQAMAIAEYRSRQSLIIQLKANVQSMITGYARTVGGISNNVVNDFASQIEEQVNDRILTETIPMKCIKTSNDIFWVLSMYNKTEAAKLIADIIEREIPRYTDFKSMDALTLMKQQLDQISTSPKLVDY